MKTNGLAFVHCTIRPFAASSLAGVTFSRGWPSRRRLPEQGLAALGQVTAADVPPNAPPPKKPPVLKVGYVRHAQAFAGGWPGHGFNNDTACHEYSQKLQALGKELGVEIDLADATITDDADAERFITAARSQWPDALLILPMGIFSMSKLANRIFDALQLPTLVFTQIGTSFTMNTAPIAHRPGST